MKNINLFLVSCFLLLSTFTFSQEKKEKKPLTHIGIKAGINLANVSIKSQGLTISPSSVVGPTGGFYASVPFGSSNFQLQPELLYSALGFQLDGVGKGQYNYLVLPILAKYVVPSSGFGIYAGPQIGFLMSAKETQTGGTSEDVKENYNSSDIASILGLEYNFPMGLNLSARYQMGLTNIVKGADTGESAKNTALSFTIGFNFK